MHSAGIEQSRCGVDEPLFGHKVVCLNSTVNVSVNTAGNTHEHMLWPLDCTAVDLEQIRLLQGLVAEIVEVKITIINDC